MIAPPPLADPIRGLAPESSAFQGAYHVQTGGGRGRFDQVLGVARTTNHGPKHLNPRWPLASDRGAQDRPGSANAAERREANTSKSSERWDKSETTDAADDSDGDIKEAAESQAPAEPASADVLPREVAPVEGDAGKAAAATAEGEHGDVEPTDATSAAAAVTSAVASNGVSASAVGGAGDAGELSGQTAAAGRHDSLQIGSAPPPASSAQRSAGSATGATIADGIATPVGGGDAGGTRGGQDQESGGDDGGEPTQSQVSPLRLAASSTAPDEAEPAGGTPAHHPVTAPPPGAAATADPAAGPALSPPASPSGEPGSVVAAATRQTGAGGAPASGDAEGDLNAARVARGMSQALKSHGGAVTLRLTPPELGTVRVHLEMQGTTVSARFHAQTDTAQAMLSRQLTQLRQGLEAQGLTVDRLSVASLSSDGSGDASNSRDDRGRDGMPEGRSRGQHGGGSSNDRGDGGRRQRAASPFAELFAGETVP